MKDLDIEIGNNVAILTGNIDVKLPSWAFRCPEIYSGNEYNDLAIAAGIPPDEEKIYIFSKKGIFILDTYHFSFPPFKVFPVDKGRKLKFVNEYDAVLILPIDKCLKLSKTKMLYETENA